MMNLGLNEKVFAMIEEETKRYRPSKNYLEHLPPLELHEFETEMLKNEMERMERGQPIKMFSMERYELPAPSAARRSEPTEWLKAYENSQSQLFHQDVRLFNLDLLSKYGAEAWKEYNSKLTSTIGSLQKQHHELKKEMQEVNWQRKNSQTTAGEKVKILEEKWVTLVSKNFEIERACVELENELQALTEAKEKANAKKTSSNDDPD
uniref:Pre-mRNA-splicing factor SPF27 n=1 Tax=Tetranychus urticae TaxID=32264 RepID=T1KRH1_TETUR